jgi:hypothetical protein
MARHFGIPQHEDQDRDDNHDLRRLIGIAVPIGALIVFVIMIVWIVGMLIAWPAGAGDPTGYWHQQIAEGKAPPAAWWNSLASGRGSCCSSFDGVKVEDVDWDTGGPNGGYRVRLYGDWVLVPPDAVLTDPNRYGPAVVWPYKATDDTTQIRCFLPGAGA